jgi:hypothetical protein
MVTKKAGGKRAASKRSSKKAGGAAAGGGEDDFTSGPTNENIRPDSGPKPATHPGRTGELFADRKISEIDAAARDYEDTKLRRMALTTEEVEKKEKLKGVMKKHKKETYSCDGVEIVVSKEETETIKVKVAKKDEDG